MPLTEEPANQEGTDPRLEAVRQCLERLPAEVRQLLSRQAEDGLTLDALADRLLAPGGSANARRLAVRRRLKAAQEALREKLVSSYPELDWPEEPPLPTT